MVFGVPQLTSPAVGKTIKAKDINSRDATPFICLDVSVIVIKVSYPSLI